MNGMRSYWKLLTASAGVALLITNCTIKSATDAGTAGSGDGSCTVGTRHTGCSCTGGLIGAQTCLPDGTYGSCVCAMDSGGTGGMSSSTGGTASSTAGTGGVATTSGGAGGYAGGYSGGAGAAAATAGSGGAAACDAGIDPSDCYSCLSQLCAKQWAACSADNETTVAQPGDPYCLSQGASADPGQIELILNCVATERAKGALVKRDVVRACGATIGDSPDPQYFLWAPEEMTQATKDLMNCMADAPDTAPADAGAWANDPNNFPDDGGTLAPWAACTCAKISCTSGQ